MIFQLGRYIVSLFAIALVCVLGLVLDAAADPLLPYGPYTCEQGYVWREAVSGDFVCVSPAARSEAAAENAAGPSHREPGGGTYGPDTCKQGFVWRETRVSDHICVPPQRRERVRVDNELAPRLMVFPPAAPKNGITVRQERSNDGQVRLYVNSRSFSPNKKVAFYAYDETGLRGDRGLVDIADISADPNGALPLNSNDGWTRFHQFSCLSYYLTWTSPVIVVDEGSGIVSNAGRTISPWCAP